MAIKIKTGGEWVDVSQSGGTVTEVAVKQYSDDLGDGPGQSDPRTERTCDAHNSPITVVNSGTTATLGIGTTSNAYGNRFIQQFDPTTSDGGSFTVCDGDLWYDTSASEDSQGEFLGCVTANTTSSVTGSEDTWVDTGLTVNYTPKSTDSTIHVTSHITMFGSAKQDSAGSHPGNFKLRLRVQPSGGSETTVGEELQGKFGETANATYIHYGTQKEWQFVFHEEYSNSTMTQKTFHLECMEQDETVIEICRNSGRSFIVVMEIKN